jgi:hypothetical protein
MTEISAHMINETEKRYSCVSTRTNLARKHQQGLTALMGNDNVKLASCCIK